MNKEFTETDFQHLSFIKDFQAILDLHISPEPDEIHEIKIGCEALKYQIRDILERIKALDLIKENVSVIDMCESNVNIPLHRYIEQCKKPWLQGKLTVALMGHFNTGKTSAMNCFFGESFPTSENEATALPTYLYEGNNPNQTALLVDKDDGMLEINNDQLKLFSFEKSFNFPFTRMFSYIAKKSEHPALANMTFIDTPGLFATTSEHGHSTYRVIDYCDVIFWFIDCRKSISNSEVPFIKEQIGNKPVYIIFSFVDALGLTSNGAQKAQEVILQRLAEEQITIKGHLQFGRKKTTQEQFKIDFNKTIETLISNYQTVNPIYQIIEFLKGLQEGIIGTLKEVTKLKNQQKKDSNKIENKISASTHSVQSAFTSVSNRFNDMIKTLNDRCANVTFCTGGAYNTLRSNVSQLASSLNTIAEAWDNVDYKVIVQYGSLSANIERLNDVISRLDSINSDINNILNTFKS